MTPRWSINLPVQDTEEEKTKVVVDDVDLTRYLRAVEIRCEANQAPVVILHAWGQVNIQGSGMVLAEGPITPPAPTTLGA
jgi:hypothetical protein